jgi:hypothetical protein
VESRWQYGRAMASGGRPQPVAAEHRADALFALPRLPRRVVLLGDPPGWGQDLLERGLELVADADDADLAVATENHAGAAVLSRAGSVIVDGERTAVRTLREAGLSTVRLLPVPVSGSPVLFVNLEQRRAARYGLEHGIVHAERWRTVRNRLAGLLVGAGIAPAPALVTLGTRTAGTPAFLEAARDLGVHPDASWLMLVSAGSVVRRNALVLFVPGSREPQHVLKFGRVVGLSDAFDRDKRAAALVARTGGSVAARAPAYLGRFEVDGYHASLESAAVGTKLALLLRRPGSRASKLRAVEPVARWLIDVARETAAPTEALEVERQRFAAEILPFWALEGAEPATLEALPPVPATFHHFDVAEENVVVGKRGFMVLDWEWAKPHGLPLSDLVYFGVHVLRIVDGALSEEERDGHFVDVMTGRAESSVVLFAWIRAAVEALGLPPESLGALITLGWLERGKLSREERLRAEKVGGTSLGKPFAERAAEVWLSHPALGPGWDAWRR